MTAHIIESTLFALAILAALALGIPVRPARRHKLLLLAAVKFAVPWQWIVALGARFAPDVGRTLPPLPELRWGSGAAIEFAAPPAAAEHWPWIAAVWACGSTACLAAWLWRCREERPRGLRAAPEWKPVAGVDVFISAENREPAVFGLWRPVLILPEILCKRLSEEELGAVVLHEAAHVLRRDNLAAVFVRMVVTAFWFHPLLWRIERRALAERERACDEYVREAGAAADVYAAGVLKVCEVCALGHAAGRSGVAGLGLERRIQEMTASLRKERFPRTARLLAAAAWSGLVVIPLTFGVLSRAQTARSLADDPSGTNIEYVRIDGADSPTAASQLEERLRTRFVTTAPEPFSDWFDEVEVLLTDEESKEWEAAATAADREDFVRRFWQRRDPSPGTSANETKDEYDRRVRYADARLSHRETATPGSMTLRGRAYRLLGPPDEIESHPSGGRGTLSPWTEWRWNSYPAEGQFLLIKFLLPAE